MFGPDVEQKIITHALSCAPEESCGFIVNGQYVPALNVHPDPRNHFEIADSHYPLAGLEAVIHSHPCGTVYPTLDDQKGQLRTGVPWGIVVMPEKTKPYLFFYGKGVKPPPLLERDFRWGPSGTDNGGDCFALLKDYYAQHLSIDLPEYPREFLWWEKGQDLFRENFTQYGFREIDRNDIQIHDIVLMKIHSTTTNHVGILTSSAHMLHQIQDHQSRQSLFGHWEKTVSHYLTYDNHGRDHEEKSSPTRLFGGKIRI